MTRPQHQVVDKNDVTNQNKECYIPRCLSKAGLWPVQE